MQAIIFTEYGSPDVLQCAEIEKPAPARNEILIRVYAASINPLDFHNMRGSPCIIRLQSGLRRPKNPRLGVDLSGEVEVVGQDVTDFQPGDAVFGVRTGALAEYVITTGKAFAPKPRTSPSSRLQSFRWPASLPFRGCAIKGNSSPARHCWSTARPVVSARSPCRSPGR